MSRCPQLVSASLLAVLLAGCSGGGDKPAALPTLTPAPSPTATVAPVPPAALAQTQQGADAFVRYFFQQMNVAFSRSDPNLIASLQNGHCVTCDNYEKALASARDGGRYIRGESFTVADVAAAPPQGDAAQVEVFGSVPARAQVDGSGRVVEALKAVARFHLIVTVQRGAAGWLVSDIALGSS